jgi:SAM-dependent methyltransferase
MELRHCSKSYELIPGFDRISHIDDPRCRTEDQVQRARNPENVENAPLHRSKEPPRFPGERTMNRNFDDRLICPTCGSRLRRDADHFSCGDHTFGMSIQRIPVLIDPAKSIVDPTSFDLGSEAKTAKRRRGALLDVLAKLLIRLQPERTLRVTDFTGADAAAQIAREIDDPDFLILGAGSSKPRIWRGNIIATDIRPIPGLDYVCDAHDLPFEDECFDAVIITAVLQHVLAPWRVVAEIKRVLRPRGFVFATSPFIAQVHGGRYDFTRWTFTGHRAMFAGFRMLQAGIAIGPTTALAWTITHWLATWSEGRRYRWVVNNAMVFVAWPFLQIDRWLARKPGAYDGAGGFYFFGQKSERRLTAREILAEHRGLHPM